MATVEKAEELLEKLRSASWNAAVQGMSFSFCFYTPTPVFLMDYIFDGVGLE